MSFHFRGFARPAEVPMDNIVGHGPRRGGRQSGQILILAVLAMVVMIAGVALLVDGGNAYAQQRAVQNGADAGANAGAIVLAQKLSGLTKTGTHVHQAMVVNAGLNSVSTTAYYTDVTGQPIDAGGNVVAAADAAPVVDGGAIPPNAQGVHNGSSRPFGTTFAGSIGISSLVASAEATAITGRLIGGQFLPVVFPINITNCLQNGSLGTPMADWVWGAPSTVSGAHPVGPEYIVPLCKTGSGSFMVLDFDGIRNNCPDEVTNPSFVDLLTPTYVASDNGNNCANLMEAAVNSLRGHTVLVPICDSECVTTGGSNALYHIVGVRGFYIDYMSDTNNQNNPACQTHLNNDTPPQTVLTIAGNGSSSCLVGWFVTDIQSGTVGAGTVDPGEAIALQLIK